MRATDKLFNEIKYWFQKQYPHLGPADVTIHDVLRFLQDEKGVNLDELSKLPTVSENEKLREAIKNLVDATEDKNGQFSAWHKHLREMTKAAKTLIS